MRLTSHFHLKLTLKMCGTIIPLLLYYHDVVLNQVQGQLSLDSCRSATSGAYYFVTFASYLASAVVQVRSLLVWDVAWHKLVLRYQNFETACHSFSWTA